MKKTSVDWLYKTMLNIVLQMLESKISVEEYKSLLIDAQQTARKMHREEVEEAFVAGDERGTGEIPFNAEQYYSQTFETP